MTGIEVLWTTLFFVGACFSTWNLVENYRDLFAVWEQEIDGDAEGEVKLIIGTEWVRLLELLAGLAAGVCSLLHVFPHATLVLLFILPIGLAFNTFRSVRYRMLYSRAHKRRRHKDGGSEHKAV